MKNKSKVFNPSPAFRIFCDHCVREAQRILNLQDWSVTLEFVPIVPGYQHNPSDSGYTMEVEIDKMYMCAIISVSRLSQEIFEKGDFMTIRQDFVHELCHVITWDAFEKVTPERKRIHLDENLTQKVAVIASKLLCA